MSIYINGPLNVVRLEGQVNNIKKIIYLFMDIHIDPQYQTECADIRSKDIKEYFVENFDKIGGADKVYDFLVEYFPTDLPKEDLFFRKFHKGRYIKQIRKLFESGMNIKNDKIKVSKNFPNVRFHYIDIRDYMESTKKFTNAADKLHNYIYDIWRRGFYEGDTSLIKDTANITTSHGKYLYDIFYDSKSKMRRSTPKPIIPRTAEELSKYTDKDIDRTVRHIINKIKNIYNHKKVKEKINKYINNELKNNFNKFFDAANKLEKFIVDNDKVIKHPDDKIYNTKDKGAMYGYPRIFLRNLANTLVQLGYDYDTYWTFFQLEIMDIYFLRRFLDKDYITNAITYTGASHSVNYIYVLVKYFGFNITHYSHMKYNIKKTTDLIKKSKDSSDIEILFFPETLLQCSDLSNFPKLFN